MVHIEALNLTVRLTCADRLNLRGVIGYAVHAHLVAFEVRIEEAHVHRSLGLDDAAVFAEQRDVDGHGILEHLALILDGLGHSFDYFGTLDFRCLDRGAFGQNAFACGHFDDDVVNVRVSLENRAVYIGCHFDGFSRLGGFGLPALHLSFVACDYHGVRRDGIGSVAGSVALGTRFGGFDSDSERTRYQSGIKNITPPPVFLNNRFLAVNNGLYGCDFVALVGVNLQIEFFVGGNIECFGGGRYRLIEKYKVCILEIELDSSNIGVGSRLVFARFRLTLIRNRGKIARRFRLFARRILLLL